MGICILYMHYVRKVLTDMYIFGYNVDIILTFYLFLPNVYFVSLFTVLEGGVAKWFYIAAANLVIAGSWVYLKTNNWSN